MKAGHRRAGGIRVVVHLGRVPAVAALEGLCRLPLRDHLVAAGESLGGVSTRELLARALVKPEAKYMLVLGYDHGWATNLPLEEFLSEDALLADTHDGKAIALEHGGPVRLIVSRLYAWKSAKWVKAIELIAGDRAGYWEQGGYHMHGDPWREERFRYG